MKISNPILLRVLIGTSATLAVLLFNGCDEKKAEPAPTKSQTTGGTEGDEGDDDDGDDGGSSGSFDLCKDGLKASSSKLSTWKSLVAELCDDGKLKELRKSSNVFTGDTPKILEESEIGSTETDMNLYSAANYSANVDDYWAMVQLQFKNPSAFKENFEYDKGVEMRDVKTTSTTASYDYENSGDSDGGVVRYLAKTTFVTLKKGQAYVAATQHVKMEETMKALKGLIIVNKKSSSTVEVITISYQTYEHDDGQGETVKKKAITSLEDEQKRAFKNAKNAGDAPDLLD